MYYLWNMDYETSLTRLGTALRKARLERGLTQVDVAKRAGLVRGRVIQAEKGDPSLSMRSYAQLVAALGMELNLVPATRPTLDDIHELMADD